MANDETASKQRAEKIARANERYTLNLQRAFWDLLPKLKRAYGQPAGDAAVTRSQDADALWAIAGFLDRMGPVGDLARFADQFAKLAQKLDDLDKGIRAPSLEPAPVTSRRPDPTIIWVARAHVVIAVKTMQRCGHIRESAAKREDKRHPELNSAAEWVAKRHPELKKLITENAVHRGDDLKKTIICWCEDFSSHKIRNKRAAGVYSVGLDKLKAAAPNCTIDQIEGEADRLLQRAVALLI
jgi:hypothetical protein